MEKNLEKNIYFNSSFVKEGYSVVGPKENNGKCTGIFDCVYDDDRCGEKSFEKAELCLFKNAFYGVINKAKIDQDDINTVIAGDLLNQIVSSSFTVRNLHPSFVGIYNACATFVESLILGALLVDSQKLNNVICMSGSHFSTAERQYRYPLELGVLRSPVTQWTATGVGSTILTSENNAFYPKVTSARFGRVIDYGTMDINNMGAAMAPAAVDTALKYFEAEKTSPKDYDAIFTGDLGLLGSQIFLDMLYKRGVDIEQTEYHDCGEMLFSKNQKTFQGGSGAACSAIIFNSKIMNGLKNGTYRKVLLFGTGALMSPLTSFQGESIPCIAHCVEIKGGSVC